MTTTTTITNKDETETTRSVLDLGSLLPTPKDGIVTPISFRVKQRGLRGFLAEADSLETGKRSITGEWIINKRLWKRMQTEFAMNKSVRKDRVILYLHGGAYYMMSAETHRFLTISVSRYTESRVFGTSISTPLCHFNVLTLHFRYS
jgi:hypothetical protein